MVEQGLHLNSLFHALADGTRRDILNRVAEVELSISELAKSYAMSFAAIAKHVNVLEKAQLIKKERRGKEQIISMSPQTVQLAQEHIAQYTRLWNERFDKLENVLLNNKKENP